MPSAIFRSWFRAAPLLLVLTLLCGCIPGATCTGNCQNGQGTMRYMGGYSYSGEWRDGLAHGQGSFIWDDGTRFDGLFKDGRRVGPGALTRVNGQVTRGAWNDAKPLIHQNAAEFRADPPVLDGNGPVPLSAALDQTSAPAQAAQQSSPQNALPPKAAQDVNAAAGPDSRRVALVIGNGAYKDGPLKNPVNDARDIAATLKRLGFEVILRQNASLREMELAVDQFYASLKKGGVGLFYFAGHGLQVGGINYLVPIGARLASESDVRFEAVDAGRVLGKMEDAGNPLNLVILDACRNNPFARSFRSGAQGLAKMDAPTGSLIAYATAPGSVAADGEGANGLYTKHLLQNLATPGLSVEEMFKRVRLGVVAETQRKQVPWEASSLTGNFSFAR